MKRTMVTVSEQVYRKVADTTNTDAGELPPLYDAIDPDALDALVENMSDGKVTFTFAGHTVTVTSDGTISLHEHSTGFPTTEITGSAD